jgi:hypothetical protein
MLALDVSAASPSCATAQGSWTDETGSGNGSGTWGLTVDDRGNISGIHRYSNPGTICPGGDWGVQGQMRSNGQFELTATWNSLFTRPAGCAEKMSRKGTLQQPGCNVANGSWTNSGGVSGTFKMSHSCDVPNGSGETTPAFRFWSDGGSGTTAYFEQSLLPTNFNYGGRFIYETFNNAENVDTCYWEGSRYLPVSKPNGEPMYRPSEVPANYQDKVGMSPEIIIYFRNNGRAPCGYALKQRMKIDCDAATGNQQYRVNDLIMKAELLDVVSGRSSTVVSKRWGPVPSSFLLPIIDFLLGAAAGGLEQ